MNKKDYYYLFKECPTLQDKFWLVELQIKLESRIRKELTEVEDD